MNRTPAHRRLPSPNTPARLAAMAAFALCLLLRHATDCLGQSQPVTNAMTTNTVQSPPATPAPATSNIVTQPPLVATNQYPAVPPPRTAPTMSGSTIRSTFSEKFIVQGRTLKLPAPEESAQPAAPDEWKRSILFGMNMTQGNSDSLRYALGLDAVRTADMQTMRVRGRSAYGESEGQKDAENASAMVRYDRTLTHRIYALGDVDWLTDTIADVDYRVLGILSPGIHLARGERSVCKLEIGAGYLTEKKGVAKESFVAGRAAGILERLFNDHVLGWCSIEYLPKLADRDVFFINAEAGIVSMLTRDLHLHCTVEDRYDNAPAEDKTSNDLIFTTSVSLNF